MSDSFYVFLPSNVQDATGNNTVANYVTRLPEKLILEGDWEVGLSEIIFTKSWFNVYDDIDVGLYREDGVRATNTKSFDAGCYADIQLLLDKVNTITMQLSNEYTASEKDPPVAHIDEKLKRIVFYPGNYKDKLWHPILPPEILAMFGFDSSDSVYNTNLFKKVIQLQGRKKIKGGLLAKYGYDINAGIHGLYVYTDIAKPSIVGDSVTSLLRIVNVGNSPFGGSYIYIYDKPIYMKVIKKEITSIEIDVKDDIGRTLKFDNRGRIQIVLHFRKRKNTYE
jgi:hypothetical protein